MKFPWTGANELATSLSIGDRIEYRRRGFFSFRATKWAVCLEVQGCSLNNNSSPPRAKNVRVVQVNQKGKKIGTYSLEEFIRDGEGRINNPPVKQIEEKPKESFSPIKKLWRNVCNIFSNTLNRFRHFVGHNRGNIFTVGTGVGLIGIGISLAGLSITAAVFTTVLASGTLLLLYLDPYHKRLALKKPSPKPPVAPRYTRTPARFAYNGRTKGYRSL